MPPLALKVTYNPLTVRTDVLPTIALLFEPHAILIADCVRGFSFLSLNVMIDCESTDFVVCYCVTISSLFLRCCHCGKPCRSVTIILHTSAMHFVVLFHCTSRSHTLDTLHVLLTIALLFESHALLTVDCVRSHFIEFFKSEAASERCAVLVNGFCQL